MGINVSSEVVQALLSLLMTAITYAAVQASRWMHHQISKVKNEQQARSFNQALDIVGKITKTVVADLEQTMVAELRTVTADGKISQAEANNIKNTALKEIYAQMTEEVFEVLHTSLADVNGFICKKIEEEVLKLKVGTE